MYAIMSHGGPNIECPAVLGENSWSYRDIKMRPCHVSSWFLFSD